MAVGAEQSQVLEPVVAPVAVDVVELERDRRAAPLVLQATLTLRLLEPSRDQPSFLTRSLDKSGP